MSETVLGTRTFVLMCNETFVMSVACHFVLTLVFF